MVYTSSGSPEAVAHALSEDSDQTARMRRLIWVFVGRTSIFVGFVARRLNCFDTAMYKSKTKLVYSFILFPKPQINFSSDCFFSMA